MVVDVKDPNYKVMSWLMCCSICGEVLTNLNELNQNLLVGTDRIASITNSISEHEANSKHQGEYNLVWIYRPIKCDECGETSKRLEPNKSWITPVNEWSYSHTVATGHVDFSLTKIVL